jgi:hypothetical protein
MPVCLRPDKTFKFSLNGDRNIPPAKRPYFIGRFITTERRAEIIKKAAELRAGPADAVDAARSELIRSVVAGVAGMGDLTLDDLLGTDPAKALTNGERWEVLYGIANENEMSEEEIKNSVSP